MNEEEIQKVTDHLINIITCSEILIYEMDAIKEIPQLYSGSLKAGVKQAYNQLIKYTDKTYKFMDTGNGEGKQFADLCSDYSKLLHILAKLPTKDRVEISHYIEENYEIH